MYPSLARLLLAMVLLLAAGGARAVDDAPSAEGVVVCPQCEGAGTAACRMKCVAGKIQCPGACLKREDPGWKPGAEVGRDRGQAWKYYPRRKRGEKGGDWVSDAHIGEVIAYVDGIAVTRGLCPKCGGSTKQTCLPCNGTGKRVCPLCKGKKEVLSSEAEEAKAAEKKKMKDAVEFVLTDGRTIRGKEMMRTNTKVVIRTEDGEVVEVSPDEIVPAKAPAPEK
jgi:hypothetical protein